MTRRAFGEPCHASRPNCEDLWAKLDDGQKQEVTGLLKQLVRKSYRKNLLKTLDYDIAYKGEKGQGSDTRVVTEAQNKLKPRDPPVRVEYIVRQTDRGFICVDFVTEGSSLTKNYYDQFKTKMDDPNLGYPNIVAKLKEKIAKSGPDQLNLLFGERSEEQTRTAIESPRRSCVPGPAVHRRSDESCGRTSTTGRDRARRLGESGGRHASPHPDAPGALSTGSSCPDTPDEAARERVRSSGERGISSRASWASLNRLPDTGRSPSKLRPSASQVAAPPGLSAPVALPSVTLAEIYAAQGHRARAVDTLEGVLAREPDHAAASALLALSSKTRATPSPLRACHPSETRRRLPRGPRRTTRSASSRCRRLTARAPRARTAPRPSRPTSSTTRRCPAPTASTSASRSRSTRARSTSTGDPREDDRVRLRVTRPRGTIALRLVVIVPTWDGPRRIDDLTGGTLAVAARDLRPSASCLASSVGKHGDAFPARSRIAASRPAGAHRRPGRRRARSLDADRFAPPSAGG